MVMPTANQTALQTIPEPFPGFGERAKAIARDTRAATKRLQEVEGRLASHEKSQARIRVPRNLDIQQLLTVPSKEVSRQVWQEEKNTLLAERVEAVRQVGRASWFTDFFDALPNLIAVGAVSNLNDYMTLMKSDPTGILSEEDLADAQDTLSKMVTDSVPAPREDAPDWLKIEPEQETAIRKAFALEPKPPETIHRITVNALLKSLTAKPTLNIPEDWTPEQLLQLASIMDIPAEDMQRTVAFSELLQPYADAISEREEKIKAILAGEDKWEMPELSTWQDITLFLLSPMQTAADIIKPYIENVSYPIAGFAVRMASFWTDQWDIDKKYAEMKAMGYSPWDAMSEAYQEWELPWYWKLPLEIVTDPITYFPGWMLKIPGTLLTKIPTSGTRLLGGGMLALNKGVWYALDVPFDAFKALWRGLPKTFNQATKMELDGFRSLLVAASSKQSGKVISMLTPDDIAQTLTKAMKDFAATPMKHGDAFVDLGAELVKHAPLDEKSIQIWSRSLGGKVEDVVRQTVNDVEDAVGDFIIQIHPPAANAKRIALAMGIEDTPQVIGKIIKDLNILTTKYTSRVPRALEIGKTAKINPVLQMTEYLVSGQKNIISAIERSEYAKGKAFSGIVLSLMNKVDTLERGVWRMTLDRWLVRPAAEAYLGSVAYPIWNVFESMFVSVMEGVVPRQAKQEAFQRMFMGIRGVDARVMQWSASDVAGMLGTMPGREGAISLLPGKIPEKVLGLKTPKWIAGKDYAEWTARKWIVASDVWGTGYRGNFLMRKMADYMAEYSYNVAGQDLNAAFKRLIGKPPSISKKSIGLDAHELKQEMFERLTTGLKSEVLGMKELLSNSSLMKGEAMKILRQATEISPQAKALGEQILARGEAFRTTDDIMAFCKTIADQSIADLRAFPAQAPDAFRFMADQMESLATKEINTPEDLMQIFQHYEVMSDSASRVPMKLLGQVMDESDELKRLGKFGQLEKLWRTSRAEVETITDSINDSLLRARAVIQSKSSLLTDKQQNALNGLLERQTARVTLQEQFLKFDGRLLDDFWQLPKAQRTSAAHTELRAYRLENMLKYKGEDAVLGAGDFLERKSYAKLYGDLPAPKLIHVDASARALSADDCAKAMGANVDALTTGLMESATFQDKAYFIQMIKQSADANPTYFKGFTEDKIGQVYDDIVRGLRMSPERDLMEQKILQQVEGVKQQMIALKMTHSLSPSEEKALGQWVDDVAGGMDEVFGKEVPAIPDYDIGLGERPAAEIMTQSEIDAAIAYDIKTGAPEAQVRAYYEGKGAQKLIVDADYLTRIRTELTQAADGVGLPSVGEVTFKFDAEKVGFRLSGFREGSTLKDVTERWFASSGNEDLQILGKVASQSPEYLAKVRSILREKYPSGFIRIYRGSGKAKGQALEREFTNVTSSRKTAVEFEDTWVPTVEGTPEANVSFGKHVKGEKPSLDNILIKVDDVVAIAAVEESELIIPTKILKQYMEKPLKTPTKKVGGVTTLDEWQNIRQKASESAHKEYYKAFADYTNENIIDAVGKSIYPFWTYHLYRWFFLSRTFIRKPGTMAAWGKYNEYSDYGYQHIPGTDLEFNPAVGSAFGATFSLARHDFKSYYENLGFMGEVLDYTQKRGFYPGIHVTLPIALTSVFSGRPPEMGEVLPPLHTVGLNLFVNSKIPGVASAAKWLKDRVFHSNFHDYYTATIVSSNQVESGGKMIDGQTGVDLWFKKQRGEKLTEEEQQAWDEAYTEAAWYGVLRSEFPEFRMRAEEMLEAYKQVTQLIEEQTGITEKMQDDLWKHNLRPTDQLGGLPLDLQMSLDQMWQWRIYFGRGSILMPPEYSNLYNLIDKYYGKVENYQVTRLSAQTDSNMGFLQPTKQLHFDGGEWRREYASNWSAYTTNVDSLESDPEFADAIEAMTPEGQARLAKELGFTVPPTDPMKEAIRIYFELEMVKKTDPYTGEEDYDYLRFWLERESVRMVLPEEQRADFDTYVRRYQTPMEVLFKKVNNEYFRGYRAVTRIILEEFTDEEKALIAEYYADATTLERQKEIQDFDSHSGKKLISYWDSRKTQVRQALRRKSPKLDFWLYVFGYTKPITDEAKAMVSAWEADRTSIVRGITESPVLEKALEKVEIKRAKEVETMK